MDPLALKPEFLLSLLVAGVTALGSFLAVKFGLKATQEDVAEVLRQVGALHKRLDELEGDVTSVKVEQARLDERMKSLRESQRFRLRTSEGDTQA